ncbi:AAA family ATPase, partial [Agrobacterium pusense]|uniref:AAA family ATPase n=1 Tax=Agrobacterium pusense TaxID=648995 RepID=UPI0015737F65
ESSGIESRTLASWSYSWDHGRDLIGSSDVFVIDEAGMVASRQLARFIGEAEERGAKIVLVGDHEQLQAIGAGAPFRAIAEQIGHVELSGIRRQRHDWQRQASVAFATHKTAEGLAAYREHGDIHFAESRDVAIAQIVRDYVADSAEHPDGTRVAMAHRRADVRALNVAIRSELQNRQRLERSHQLGSSSELSDGAGREDDEELTFQTNNGKRAFAPGDRIIFLENNRDLGVKNGMLGTVQHVEKGRIVARLDGRGGDSVSIPTDSYQAIDHGYATTIHKNQGATVDRAFVLASSTVDRHLAYVAMTRHRDSVQLYADSQEFTKAGRLVDHGAAPYEHNRQARENYFVTLENDWGEQRTVWGVDLKRAMQEASPKIGDRIGLQHEGATPVTLPDGTKAERNAWRVVKGDELAYQKLTSRLSRSGLKETTLDYISDFAERRGIAGDRCIAGDQGIAEQLGLKSEIELASDRNERQEVVSRAAHLQREQQGRPSERQRVYAEPAGDLAGPVRREDPRNQFAGNIDDGRQDDRTEDNKGYRRIRWSDLMSRDRGVPAPTEAVGQHSPLEAGKPAPLVPAITRYDRSVEEVAQQRAMSVIEQRFDTVESLVRRVFRGPAEVAARLRNAMTDKEGNGKIMAKAMAEQPERFGELRGKSGLFGNSKERKEALQYARSLAAHIGHVSEAWERRLGEERQSEQWQREQRDVIEVPGLTSRSAEILAEVEKTPVERRSKFIKELRSSPEGRTALGEAKLVAEALTQRFGSSDPRRFAEELDTRPELAKHVEQIEAIARMVYRIRHADLSHDHTLKRQLVRSQGLGLSR